jgi:hypothetical protein
MRSELNSNPWPESVNELYRPSDRRLLAKLVQTFVDRGCHVVSATDPYGRSGCYNVISAQCSECQSECQAL